MAPKELFELPAATMETAALLTSTFTFGMASLAIKYGRGLRKVMLWLLVTLALGVVFLALEAREFTCVLAEGAVPQRSGFLSAFFGLVPLHGTHVTCRRDLARDDAYTARSNRSDRSCQLAHRPPGSVLALS